jgi:hypothetical protein
MNRFVNLSLFLLLFLWELPQNIGGFVCLVVMHFSGRIRLGRLQQNRLQIETNSIGVSLGWFIFYSHSLNRISRGMNDCLMHEMGHSFQSRMLGPLYLVIIGIPSLMRVAYARYYRKRKGISWTHYFDGYPENWADQLGGADLLIKHKK